MYQTIKNEQNDDLDQLTSMVHLANDQDDEEEDAVHHMISSMHHFDINNNATTDIDLKDLNFA